MERKNNDDNLYSWYNAIIILTLIIWTTAFFSTPFIYDVECWEEWINEISAFGITGTSSNYPPVILYWFQIITYLYSYLNIYLTSFTAIKVVTLLPLTILHFVTIAYLFNNYCNKKYAKYILCALAISPVTILNGPIWGQIDLLPIYLALFSFELLKKNNITASGLFFGILICTKLQFIFFLPVFCFILYNQKSNIFKFFLYASSIFCIIWLPWIINGAISDGLIQAYSGNLNKYNFITVSASNFWWILFGTQYSDVEPLFTLNFDNSLFTWQITITLKTLSLITLAGLLFISLIHFRNNPAAVYRNTFLSCLIFFIFAPQMHERYLIYAAIFSIFMLFEDSKFFIETIIVNIAALMNMLLVIQLEGDGIWTIIFFGIFSILISILSPYKFKKSVIGILADKPMFNTYLTAILMGSFFFFGTIMKAYLQNCCSGKTYLSAMPLYKDSQNWKDLQRNRSITKKNLSIGRTTYVNGIGTRTDTSINFAIPSQANHFCTKYGVQDGFYGTKADFSILLDGEISWSDSIFVGKLKEKCVDTSNRKILTLRTDSTSKFGVDTNWIDSAFRS